MAEPTGPPAARAGTLATARPRRSTAGRVAHRRARGRTALVVVAVAQACIAAVGLLAHFRSSHHGSVIAFSDLAPYLMLGAPLAVLALAAARAWVGLTLTLALTVWCASTQVRLHVAATGPANATSVVAMTVNLDTGLADPAAVVRAVRHHHVAVLMTEDLTATEQDRLIAAGLADLLPYRASDPGDSATGAGIWSRYPLSDPKTRHDFTFAFVSARVEIPGVAVDPLLVATHMPRPWPESSGPWLHDIALLPYVLRSTDPGVPALVGGDFNATPDVAQFRHVLTAGFADAAQQAGAGMTRTYPSNTWFPPLLAIDHVLTRQAVARSVSTVEIPGTDHRALVVTVQLAGDPATRAP